MKMLSPLSLAATVAVISVTLQAQTSTSPQAPDPTMTPGSTQTNSQPRATSDAPSAAQQAAPVQAASVSAELTKSIDTKKAKVGDEVNAKTTDDTKLPDGTALPKGTKLVGNVIDVTPKSKEQKNSHLVLALNRAVTKEGHEVPIRAAVTSMTAPNSITPADSVSPGGSAGSAGMPSGGGSSAGGSSSGASAAPTPSAPMMTGNGSQGQSAQGQMLKSAQDRVAVGNMPKVMLSAPTTPDSAGVLDAEGQNISLDSGTKLTLNVIPTKPGTQGEQ